MKYLIFLLVILLSSCKTSTLYVVDKYDLVDLYELKYHPMKNVTWDTNSCAILCRKSGRDSMTFYLLRDTSCNINTGDTIQLVRKSLYLHR